MLFYSVHTVGTYIYVFVLLKKVRNTEGTKIDIRETLTKRIITSFSTICRERSVGMSIFLPIGTPLVAVWHARSSWFLYAHGN